MFSFFFPLMWLAAVTVVVPLWLHLQRKDDSHVVRFSAMRFLDDQPLARRRPLLLRDVPLLLLRMLLLLLLAAAFAWPYFRAEQPVLIQESRVFILDNTLSHQAEDRFTLARDKIAAAVASAGLETQIAVVELTSSPRVLIQFGDDAAVAASRLRALRPSHQRGSYAEAFRLAQQLIEQALGEERRIVFAGDSQANQWLDDAAVPPFLENVTVDLPDITTSELPNVALRRPVVKRVNLADRSLVQCAVHVYRLGPPQSIRVAVMANDQTILEQELELSGPEQEQSLLVEFADDPSKWLRGEIRLSEHTDALSGDDQVFFSLPPVLPGRVAVFADSIYLRTALSTDVVGRRWICQQLTGDSVGGDDLADVLCLESQFLAMDDVHQLAMDYLSGGRGVAIFVGRDTPTIAGRLRDFGIKLLGPASVPDKPREFRYVYLEHPIFQPFRTTDFGDLSKVSMAQYRRLEVPDAVPLVFSAAGDPLLMESAEARGKLLVFAFQLDRTDTNWPLQPSFVPFLDRCLQHLRPAGMELATDYEPGEVCAWSIPTDRSTKEVIVTKSGGAMNEMQRLAVKNGRVRGQLPDAPGHYELRYGEENRIQALLSLNPSPDESELIFSAKPPSLDNWQRETAATDSSESAATSLAELSRLEVLRQQYWWWLMVAGLIFLLLETVWISRKQGYAR